MRTKKAQIIRAVWSAPLLFAAWIVWYLFLLSPKFHDPSSSHQLSRPVWVLPGRKTRRQVFLWRGSYDTVNLHTAFKFASWFHNVSIRSCQCWCIYNPHWILEMSENFYIIKKKFKLLKAVPVKILSFSFCLLKMLSIMTHFFTILYPYGPRQANLVLIIAYASSEGSGEPAHLRSLARTSAARSYKQWVKRNLQTESHIPGPSEWLGMRS